MANTFVNAEKVVRTGLGLLERELVLPRLVWRDAGGSFRGAKDDTISIRVPAYLTHRTRVMRSPTALVFDELAETKVDVTLDTHVYKGIRISDEEMTLDIVDFSEQVTMPAARAVARGVEDTVATAITGATYPADSQVVIDEAAPLAAVLRARRLLNDANVPFEGRVLLLGSAVEELILGTNLLTQVDTSGSDSALRDAIIGRLRGFTVVTSNAIPPGEAYAFHRTAFALALQAPVVPAGASWGDSVAAGGIAMRALRDYAPEATGGPSDRLLVDVFAGADVVTDEGEFDENGKFVPWDGDGHEPDGVLTRAVKLTYDEGS